MTKKELNLNHEPVVEIRSCINTIEKQHFLYEEKNFDERIGIIDTIKFPIIDQLEELLRKVEQPNELVLLKHRAELIKLELEQVDVRLFKKLQANIRIGEYKGRGFKNLVNEYFDFDSYEHHEEIGYDNLDLFINGLLPFQCMPAQTRDLEPEMVYYQKTPARIVFELVEKVHFAKEDVFFDLGSGLGQVAMLVNLLSGVTVKGIEFEPAFCGYAQDCAADLNLSGVTFINIDARKADYSDGTAFFMYTPFNGGMMQEVLELLKKESLLRKIKIITYGPCTAQVALQSWLHFEAPKDSSIYELGIFTSL